MKNATIALLTATTLVLASLQAAAESKRGGGMAPTGKGSGPGTTKQPGGGMSGYDQPMHDQMRPSGGMAGSKQKKQRSGKTGKGMQPVEPCCSAPRPGQR